MSERGGGGRDRRDNDYFLHLTSKSNTWTLYSSPRWRCIHSMPKSFVTWLLWGSIKTERSMSHYEQEIELGEQDRGICEEEARALCASLP